MKKRDFDSIKPGIKLYRRMDVGQIIRTVESTHTTDRGFQFITFRGDKEARRWEGVYGHYNKFIEVKNGVEEGKRSGASSDSSN